MPARAGRLGAGCAAHGAGAPIANRNAGSRRKEAANRMCTRPRTALWIPVLLAGLIAAGGVRAQVAVTGVTLAWTAPGDDSLAGTATRYDLRWSPAPIATLADFARAGTSRTRCWARSPCGPGPPPPGHGRTGGRAARRRRRRGTRPPGRRGDRAIRDGDGTRARDRVLVRAPHVRRGGERLGPLERGPGHDARVERRGASRADHAGARFLHEHLGDRGVDRRRRRQPDRRVQRGRGALVHDADHRGQLERRGERVRRAHARSPGDDFYGASTATGRPQS